MMAGAAAVVALGDLEAATRAAAALRVIGRKCMEAKLSDLVERLQKAHGESLVSVILYGSAAAGDHHDKFSDLNVLCVLRQVTPEELADAEPVLNWWRDAATPRRCS